MSIKKILILVSAVFATILLIAGVWFSYNYIKYTPNTYIQDSMVDGTRVVTTITTKEVAGTKVVESTTEVLPIQQKTETSAVKTSTDSPPQTSTNLAKATETAQTATSVSTPIYSLGNISKHNTSESCYSIINGYVYDLTMWVNLHPGGSKSILRICGIDGSRDFNKEHKGDSTVLSILGRYKIGLAS